MLVKTWREKLRKIDLSDRRKKPPVYPQSIETYPVARRVEQVLDTSNRRDLSYPRIHHRPGGFCPRNRDDTRIPRPSNYPDALIASPLRVHGARKRGRDAEEDWGKGLERTSSAIHGSHLQLGRVPSASL